MENENDLNQQETTPLTIKADREMSSSSGSISTSVRPSVSDNNDFISSSFSTNQASTSINIGPLPTSTTGSTAPTSTPNVSMSQNASDMIVFFFRTHVASLAQSAVGGNNNSDSILSSLPTNASQMPSRVSLLSRLNREIIKFMKFREYSMPSSSDEASQRVRTNIGYFQLIYSSVFLTVFAATVLSSPSVFIALGVIIALWYFFFFIRDPDEVFVIAGNEIRRREKLTALIPTTLVIITFGGLVSTMLNILFVSSFICGVHAALRKKIERDPLDDLTMEGESSQPPILIV